MTYKNCGKLFSNLAIASAVSVGLLAILSPLTASALTAEQVLASAKTPELIGLAIAVESDKRDQGFISSEVETTMILRNSSGQESIRKMRNKTFEIIKEGFGDKTMVVFDQPRDVKGTAFLTHSKTLEPDDQWLFLPSIKRPKRIASKNKSGPFMGSEFAFEDISSPEVDKYTYNYLGTEVCPNETSLQCFKIERFPTYKYSGYSKYITWVDTIEFRPMQSDFYDRKGAHLKTLTISGYKKYLDKFWRPASYKMVNHLNGKSTDLNWANYKFQAGLKESDFTKSKLVNVR